MVEKVNVYPEQVSREFESAIQELIRLGYAEEVVMPDGQRGFRATDVGLSKWVDLTTGLN